MNQQVFVLLFSSLLSCVVIVLTVKAFVKGMRSLNQEQEREYWNLFCKVKTVNLIGVIVMCGAFIAAAAASERSVPITLLMLLLVIIMMLIPKIIIQSIWRCPHCGNGLELGSNRGINVKLVAQCPSCKKVLCKAQYERER